MHDLQIASPMPWAFTSFPCKCVNSPSRWASAVINEFRAGVQGTLPEPMLGGLHHTLLRRTPLRRTLRQPLAAGPPYEDVTGTVNQSSSSDLMLLRTPLSKSSSTASQRTGDQAYNEDQRKSGLSHNGTVLSASSMHGSGPALFAFIVDHQLRAESSREAEATASRMHTLGLQVLV